MMHRTPRVYVEIIDKPTKTNLLGGLRVEAVYDWEFGAWRVASDQVCIWIDRDDMTEASKEWADRMIAYAGGAK